MTSELTHTWLSFHIRRDESMDRMIRECVLPISKHRGIERWFFLRYWEAGPHLRFRIYVHKQQAAEISERIMTFFREWIRHNPDEIRWTSDLYNKIAMNLARREGIAQEKVGKFRPSGDIWTQDYNPEIDKYGTEISMDAFEKHFEDSSVLAGEILEKSIDTEMKLQIAGAILLESLSSLMETSKSLEIVSSVFTSRWGDDYETPSFEFVNRSYIRQQLEGNKNHSYLLERWSQTFDHLNDALTLIGWGKERRVSGLDNVAHLFCNRIGLTIIEEVMIRKSIFDAASHYYEEN